MCIIVAKEKGIEIPSRKTLKSCFDNNGDGAGFMYVNKNKVVIDKGYMDFDTFYKRLQKIDKKFDLKNKALVMHFRIGTSGENDRETTHPFPISNKVEDLKSIYIKSDLGMVHNGIIDNYTYIDNLSDTQTFIKDFVYELKGLNKDFYKKQSILDMLSRITKSKLCFLDTNEKLYYVGDFIEDSGVKYSNGTYKESRYTYLSDNTKWKKYTPTLTKEKDLSGEGSIFEDDYDDDFYFDKYDRDINDFVREKEYYWLEQGDRVMINEEPYTITDYDDFALTSDYELYEYYGGVMSLISNNAYLIDNHGREVCINWKGI